MPDVFRRLARALALGCGCDILLRGIIEFIEAPKLVTEGAGDPSSWGESWLGPGRAAWPPEPVS